MTAPFHFSQDDWSRPHGFKKTEDDTLHVWDAMIMGWRVFKERKQVETVYPDHERMRADPDYAPLIALVHRKLSPPKKHLHLVKG